MILSMTVPDNVPISTQTLSLSENGYCIILRSCPRLQAEIASKWQGVIDGQPIIL